MVVQRVNRMLNMREKQSKIVGISELGGISGGNIAGYNCTYIYDSSKTLLSVLQLDFASNIFLQRVCIVYLPTELFCITLIIGVPSLVIASLIIIEICSHAKKKSESVKNLYVLINKNGTKSVCINESSNTKNKENGKFFNCTYYQEIRPNRICTK